MAEIKLSTDRLILREFQESDLEELFDLDSDPEVHKYLGNKPVTMRSQTEDIIKGVRQQYIDHGIGRWIAITKDTNEMIGWSGLKYETLAINNQNGYNDIGYRFKKKYWGKGYATESANALLEYGFTELKYDKICGAAEIGNKASSKVLQKIGLNFIESFYYENLKCNWYALTSEEWHSKKS